MCGAAQNFAWLAICRGVQGIGGGGIIQLTQFTISDISACSDPATGPLADTNLLAARQHLCKTGGCTQVLWARHGELQVSWAH